MYLLCHDAVHRLYPSRAPAVGVRRLHTGHSIPLRRMVVGVEETQDALTRSCSWIVWLCLCDPTPLPTSNLQSRDRDFASPQVRVRFFIDRSLSSCLLTPTHPSPTPKVQWPALLKRLASPLAAQPPAKPPLQYIPQCHLPMCWFLQTSTVR